MDVVERLTLETARADTLLACEHRHRYEFAAALCADLRVLDLCCGSGYGSEILARTADHVVGVDNDAATIHAAMATVDSASFEIADAVAFLAGEVAERFDAVVCFEGLEHLHALDRALELLRGHAHRGVRLIASMPNSKLFREQNPYHVTDFGYDEALTAFEGFPNVAMVPQFLAEGSLICPPNARGTNVTVDVDDRDEVEYANHFIFSVNFSVEAIEHFHHGRVKATVAPLFNRWAEDTKREITALHAENARLARARLGKAQSAAAAALAALPRDQAGLEAELDAWKERCFNAEARVAALEVELAQRGVMSDGALRAVLSMPVPEGLRPVPTVGTGSPAQPERVGQPPGGPRDGESRRRHTAGCLARWVAQHVPLAGRSVLVCSAGQPAAAPAFAGLAARVVGLDSDPDSVEQARRDVTERALDNVEPEHRPVDRMLDAVAERRGEVDVVVLYGLLEHMRVAERLALLRLSREVVRPDGAIVVCETPNRLTYPDHHTTDLPFFHLLPDELALDYRHRSDRDSSAAVEVAGEQDRDAALEAIARSGRGVSFHEFELAFDDLGRHVIASSYDPLLFDARPVHAEELMLARYLERARPDLAPAWSRVWLDVILAPQPLERRASLLRPWSAATTASSRVTWTAAESLALRGADATLWIELPHPTSLLVVGTVAAEDRLELSVRGESMRSPLVCVVEGPPGRVRYTSLALPRPDRRIGLSAGGPSDVVFVGYED